MISKSYHTSDHSTGHSFSVSLGMTAEVIYEFFLHGVQTSSPEVVLDGFEQLFFYLLCPRQPEVQRALETILSVETGESCFHSTIQRCCYILINNWLLKRQQKLIKNLIQRLSNSPDIYQTCLSIQESRLILWLNNFLNSEDYQNLLQCANFDRNNWSSRYQSYLLVPQYLNPRNSREQKEVARNLAKQLKDKYKFDLAMYITRLDSPMGKNHKLNNPTQLGDEVINLIKQTISTQRVFNYGTQANLFLQNTQDFDYQKFKQCLPQYLMFNVSQQYPANILREKIEEKLQSLYRLHDQKIVNKALIIRSCNRLLEFLLIEPGKPPSFLFNLMIRQGSQLTLVILLLKLVLLGSPCRTYLEICIANLVQFYQDHAEFECQGLIQFLEIFNLVFTLFTENIQYFLVKTKDLEPGTQSGTELDTYRLFSQFKGPDLRRTNLKEIELKGQDLRGADLRDMDLKSIKLIRVDLSLAKLSHADLSQGIFTETKFFISNLNYTNLTGANLIKTDFRRAELKHANLTSTDLQHANFNRADLMGAIIIKANLQEANLENTDLTEVDLSESNLQGTNLNRANLKGANLKGANLKGANLKSANLEGVNLEGANLEGVNLEGANLEGANLENAILERAILSQANLQSTNLSNVNLMGAMVNQANLSQAILINSQLRDTNLAQSNLSYADLTKADLTRANLMQVDFTYASLRNAIVRHTNLKDAILLYADLQGANLFRSGISQAQIVGVKLGNNAGLSDQTRIFLKGEEI
ncbi:pentapeptide repeat-containing protein [Planktothrix agardhii 1806]|uniref:pentapeptide repeat-containing protein n=1 Tax=Planktothrix agardhii TaxID=1160 RepID=UPI001D09E874|nr:pentapeptide repeat-containing protein [Planktothrix agardhii]MCB8758923.1 pentapeptide repeat-containing protein [Planktothrix agardhii 1813]MCF3571988.1 pentapeptide repeat-containing protein [Planktothrix agardhii 1805]MCF3585119.1 pentapeptide repeat-containing protein [Planktothrix agardhii 1803]MCF3601800.1 pentapeptide repeat-containing protein [Planktothrix agardhii 1804]MCF3617291.1 pentapeptide repeat-containing protein [Planktothrix agardhii 1806]